jgi:hypothetical protein
MQPKSCPYCRGRHTAARLSRHQWGGRVWWMGVMWCHDCGRGFSPYWNQTEPPQLADEQLALAL